MKTKHCLTTLFALLCLILLPYKAVAQRVEFSFAQHELYDSEGNDVPSDKVRQIEDNITRLLTAVSEARPQTKMPEIMSVKLSESCTQEVLDLCNTARIVFQRDSYIMSATDEGQVYAVKGFDVMLITDNDARKVRLEVSFQPDGLITHLGMMGGRKLRQEAKQEAAQSVTAQSETVPQAVSNRADEIAIPAFDKVKFEFVDHSVVMRHGAVLPSANVAALENNISNLLTAIHVAGKNHGSIDVSGLKLDEKAKGDLKFYDNRYDIICENQNVSLRALNDDEGMQVTGVKIIFHKRDSIRYTEEDRRVLTITFNSKGFITGVCPAFATLTMAYHFSDTATVEQERFNTIRKQVELFRQYYEKMDIESLRKVFSDKAIVITGRVIQNKERKGDKMLTKKQVEYIRQNAKEYLDKLEKQVFPNNKYINVAFKDVKVSRAPKANFYAVELEQDWTAENYHDEGHVFLLWEFDENNNEPPTIHVRSWEPPREDGRYFKMADVEI